MIEKVNLAQKFDLFTEYGRFEVGVDVDPCDPA